MRKKPSMQGNGGYNKQHNRPRYSQGGSGNGGDHRSQGGGHSHHGGNRPRRNYSAAREKYLAQARDALASGDRVLAENYYQHADHCYRMMMEEGYNPRPQPVSQHQPQDNQPQQPAPSEQYIQENTSQLPAFLTANYEQPEQNKPAEPVIVQNWEE